MKLTKSVTEYNTKIPAWRKSKMENVGDGYVGPSGPKVERKKNPQSVG